MIGQSSGVRSNNIIFILVCGWGTLWLASVVQDVTIWMTGTREKIWVLDVDSEYSLYTWLSILLLSLAAFIAFVLSSYKGEVGEFIEKQWKIIGVIFLFLSMDEMLSFHERLSGILNSSLHTSGVFKFAWVIPALFAVVALGVLFLPFMRQLPYRISRTIFVAGVLYVGGAVGVEMIAGSFISESGTAEGVFTSPAYRFLTNIEEGLEVVGVIVFIKALLMQAELYFPNFFVSTVQR